LAVENKISHSQTAVFEASICNMENQSHKMEGHKKLGKQMTLFGRVLFEVAYAF